MALRGQTRSGLLDHLKLKDVHLVGLVGRCSLPGSRSVVPTSRFRCSTPGAWLRGRLPCATSWRCSAGCIATRVRRRVPEGGDPAVAKGPKVLQRQQCRSCWAWSGGWSELNAGTRRIRASIDAAVNPESRSRLGAMPLPQFRAAALDQVTSRTHAADPARDPRRGRRTWDDLATSWPGRSRRSGFTRTRCSGWRSTEHDTGAMVPVRFCSRRRCSRSRCSIAGTLWSWRWAASPRSRPRKLFAGLATVRVAGLLAHLGQPVMVLVSLFCLFRPSFRTDPRAAVSPRVLPDDDWRPGAARAGVRAVSSSTTSPRR